MNKGCIGLEDISRQEVMRAGTMVETMEMETRERILGTMSKNK